VQFFGQFSDGDYTLLVRELAPMGSLDTRLEEFEETITPQHRLTMLEQVCAGMEALADIKLIHRDLALRNILVFGYNPVDVTATSVKVCDFGLTVQSALVSSPLHHRDCTNTASGAPTAGSVGNVFSIH
jgi:serine/threonine protein kinase